MAERIGCHGDENRNDAMQHSGSDNSSSDRCKQRCGCAEDAKYGGVIPDTGFPHVGDMAKERKFGRGANTSISYNTHAFVRGLRLGFIPSKCAFRSGSSSTKEVVVHGP